jgi:hypothetical protein
MISPISTYSSVSGTGKTQTQTAEPSRINTSNKHQDSNPEQDTVQLSDTAKAALGDVDNDGDSH